MLHGNRDRLWCLGIGAALGFFVPSVLGVLAGQVSKLRWGRDSG